MIYKIFDLVLNLNKFVDTELKKCAGRIEKPLRSAPEVCITVKSNLLYEKHLPSAP
jgi:hypothetical protein